jgi:hypothetical protein
MQRAVSENQRDWGRKRRRRRGRRGKPRKTKVNHGNEKEKRKRTPPLKSHRLGIDKLLRFATRS